MASSEVGMHVEEVVVVTTQDTADDKYSVEEVKSVLVTPDLSQQGDLAEQCMEAETTTYTATPVTEKEAVLAMKLSEEVENVEQEIIYPITCGDSKGVLIWKQFVCPGINVKCVQYNEHLISPKEFVNLSGKSTLKDWKRAIRLNGIMLRKIMDTGDLDFYQHSKVCSNTCRSTKIDLVARASSLSTQQSTELIPVTPSSADVNSSQDEASEDSNEWVSAITEDTVCFWQGLKEAGILEEVIEEFQKEVKEKLKDLQDRIQHPPLQVNDAVLLNNVVQNFGMLDLVKKVLVSHKSQMDRYREQYTRSLVALEQQCDEHRKRAKEFKSKSQHLNNVLMTLTPTPTAPSPKRPRLARATSGPSITPQVSSQPVQITLGSGLPITQITNLPLDKLVTALQASNSQASITASSSPLLGGYTVLASPAGTPVEMQPNASNVTLLSTAIQDGGAIMKVMSPFQLLTLPGLGAALQNMSVALPTSAVETIVTQTEEASIIEVKGVEKAVEKQ